MNRITNQESTGDCFVSELKTIKCFSNYFVSELKTKFLLNLHLYRKILEPSDGYLFKKQKILKNGT